MLVIDFLGRMSSLINLAWRDQETGSCFSSPIPLTPPPVTPSVCFTVLHTMRRRKTRSCAGASQARRRAQGRGDDAKCPVAEQRVDRLGSPKAESMPLKDRPTPPLCNQYLKFISLCSQVLVISIYLYTSFFFVLFWPRSISVSHFSSMPFLNRAPTRR